MGLRVRYVSTHCRHAAIYTMCSTGTHVEAGVVAAHSAPVACAMDHARRPSGCKVNVIPRAQPVWLAHRFETANAPARECAPRGQNLNKNSRIQGEITARPLPPSIHRSASTIHVRLSCGTTSCAFVTDLRGVQAWMHMRMMRAPSLRAEAGASTPNLLHHLQAAPSHTHCMHSPSPGQPRHHAHAVSCM